MLQQMIAAARTRALVVEDDPAYARLIRLHLEANAYHVQHVERGSDALSGLDAFAPDVIILDVVLPDMDGFEICRRIREVSSVPVLMLTNRAEERHKVQGLMLGADDYVTKPFSAPELLARLTTIMRRAQRREQRVTPPVQVGDVTIDVAGHSVKRDGQPVGVTFSEFELLNALMTDPGRLFSREELLRAIWGDSAYRDPRAIDVHIRHLREKLEDQPERPQLILTVRGAGYRLQPV